MSASGCRREKVLGRRWMIVGAGWRAHIEGGRMRPLRTVIRIDTGTDDGYRPPMRPGEIIARLCEACAVMGAVSWSDGAIRRVDFCMDERRNQSPAPDHIPHFTLFEEYPCGGALFLAGRKRPASRAVEIYDKTLQLQQKSGKDDESCIHIWRVEMRYSTRASAKKAGISTVEDALSALLVWDVVAPAVLCQMMPEAFSTAWRRVRAECSSLVDVRRFCARLRASMRGLREDRPRKEIMDAAKGVRGHDRSKTNTKSNLLEDHFLKKGSAVSREGRGKGGGACIIIEGEQIGFLDTFHRTRAPPRAPPEQKRA